MLQIKDFALAFAHPPKKKMSVIHLVQDARVQGFELHWSFPQAVCSKEGGRDRKINPFSVSGVGGVRVCQL